MKRSFVCSSPLCPGSAIALIATLLLLGLIACTPADPGSSDGTTASDDAGLVESELLAAAREAAAVIDAESLRAHIAVLADDAMAGRGPGTPGDLAARRYIAEQMEAIGLEPGGVDGTWEQPFDIISIEAAVPATWAFRSGSGDEVALQHVDDFVAFSGVQAPEAAIENAEVVFVGYGIEAPEYGWNDYSADVAGKVVLILNNDPDWDPELFEGDRRLWYGRWDYKYQKAAEKGAIGAIIHHTQPSAGYPFAVVQNSWSGAQFELPAGDESRLQVAAWTTEAATGELMALAGQDWNALVEQAKSPEFTPVPLGLSTSIRMANTVARTQTANVLGRLPGSDPELADEVVIYGAHFDHLGEGPADDDGDTIYNGALDNALGTSQTIVTAKALAALPRAPRRSFVFALWGAEEQGLLGSRYFAANPTVPAGKIAANLNMDGGNIWGRTTDVVFIGYGKSDLDASVERFAAAQNRNVVPDQFPDRGFFYRSDQFSLAKIGVPAVYLDTGTSFVDKPEGWGREAIEAWEGEHYHRPSDELVDSWVWDGAIEDAHLLFYVGVEVAEADAMPAWTAGDEFEAARLAALGDDG